MVKKFKKGYTTGVFDLFHIGHLNILKHAKEQCDFLVVGVSTDECVKGYKNKTPIVPFAERVAIVEAINYVDKVVPQITMNKMDAWKNLQFDVIFHGDDWKGSKLYAKYEKEFAQVGVKLVFLPHTAGTSSTELAKKLQD